MGEIECAAGRGGGLFQVGKGSGGEVVHHVDRMAVAKEPVDQRRADETGSPRHKDVHVRVSREGDCRLGAFRSDLVVGVREDLWIVEKGPGLDRLDDVQRGLVVVRLVVEVHLAVG